MIRTDYLNGIAAEEGFALTEEMLDSFDRYAQLLVEWNEKMNLTAITAPDEITVKHFLDSLLLLNCLELQEHAAVIDVGTGAGFPAVPCAIARPDLQITLLDSLQKRITFLQELTAALNIPAVCIHVRAEEGGQNPVLRGQFDLASARAVARLRELTEYCLPFVKVGGTFAALKGYEIEEELGEAKKAIKLLGGEVADVRKFILPDESRRAIVLIRKISQTPTEYPRNSAKMKKQPLV